MSAILPAAVGLTAGLSVLIGGTWLQVRRSTRRYRTVTIPEGLLRHPE